MKVALIYHGCHRKGGVERLVFEAARYLAARRHEVHVFAEEWEEAPAPPHLPPSDAPATQSNAPGAHSKPSARGITAQSTSDQPNSRDARPAPTQAEPVPSPPPEAPRSGKRTTAKKRRKKRGIPIRPRRC